MNESRFNWKTLFACLAVSLAMLLSLNLLVDAIRAAEPATCRMGAVSVDVSTDELVGKTIPDATGVTGLGTDSCSSNMSA